MGSGVLPPISLKLIQEVGPAEPLPPLRDPQPKAPLLKAQACGDQTERRAVERRQRESVPFQAPLRPPQPGRPLWGRPPLSLTPTPSRSPPRPSPGSLHYSDEDVTKYNDLIPAESGSLTEKPSEISDSQVRGGRARRPGLGTGAAPSQSAGLHGGPSPGLPCLLAFIRPRKLAGSHMWTRRALLSSAQSLLQGSWGPCNLNQRRAPNSSVL